MAPDKTKKWVYHMSSRHHVLVILSLMLVNQSVAGGVNLAISVPQSIPAISQVGLIGLAVCIGITGAKLISKFKK
ncbi:MAG: hypothetical protein HOC23_16020 [Halieaceae bacterium]|jgi:hypothetical protein|nr:hypothetical protein [Gammaproteobacteria bacterium]MBT4521507.1 hypothetical protein [Halieaceae bacterium]